VAQELVFRTTVVETTEKAINAVAMFSSSGEKSDGASSTIADKETVSDSNPRTATNLSEKHSVTDTPETRRKFALSMPGIISPTGFFDPAGFTPGQYPEQLKYSRESEIKHGRVAMLAVVGFPFAEEFHPLFPNVNVPSDFAFQLTPLQTFWPLVVLAVGLFETFSISTFKDLKDGTWELKDDHISGNLGFDPLGLKPTDPKKYLDIQNKELSNGRLAMIGIAGMVAQELVYRTTVVDITEKAAGFTPSIAMF